MTTPNTAQAHTAEPWRQGDHESYHPRVLFHAPKNKEEAYIPIAQFEREEDAKRALIAVNALAGIPDPADAIREAREALESIVKALGYAEWGSDAHAEEILSQIVRDHYVPLKAALAAITPKGDT